MTEEHIPLNGIAQETQKLILRFMSQTRETLGVHLESINLIGSVLTDDYDPKRSDINTVLVISKQSREILDRMARLLKQSRTRGLGLPLLMTSDYIDRSRDVFGIELLDFQLNHRTLCGEDPFEDLVFEHPHVRLQCERELKAMLIRLRQGYMASYNDHKRMKDIMIATVKGMLSLFRATLWLHDKDRDPQCLKTTEQIKESFGLEVEVLTTILDWRYGRSRVQSEDYAAQFDDLYTLINHLADIIDRFEETT